jgi:hypothetical protein
MQKQSIKRKLIALVLTAAILAALTGSAAALSSGFPDVRDSELAGDIAVLQMMGVISGDENGNFSPDGTLTRAQFCKMAVVAMGKGDQAALYQNRTIFPDVRAGHWARGYINYSVTGENKLIIGNSDGTFRPDSPITVAQAVTILLRMLGYSDTDAGMLWPDGYLALAADKKLTDGINMSAPGAPISPISWAQRRRPAEPSCPALARPFRMPSSWRSMSPLKTAPLARFARQRAFIRRLTALSPPVFSACAGHLLSALPESC